MFLLSGTSRTTPKRRGGFSLVELMITLAIVFLVTGMALVKYSSFNYTVLLKSQAYELALDIRQAQVFGISASGQTGTFNQAYGIYIDLGVSSLNYQLFQDITPGTQYRYNNGEAVGLVNSIDPRFTISQICDQANSCTTSGNASIAFKRPNFDAILYLGNTRKTRLEITLASVDDPTITWVVKIYQSGQIMVQ